MMTACGRALPLPLALLASAAAAAAAELAERPSCPASAPDPRFVEAPWGELAGGAAAKDVQPVDISAGGPARDDPLWLTDQPGATVYSGTMGSTSMAGWATTNSTAAKYVTLKTAADASEALKFAASYNLAVSVKNTGHDFFGRSARHGSLMLWTHKMTQIAWQDAFTPAGCATSAGSTVTVGAGVQFWHLYDQASERNKMVVGGTCSTVGHAGFTLGGGYGDYSRMYGSGATNLVEAEVVLADGRVVTANSCGPHSDLFRALRGGGGAFGVMTKATYRTYPFPAGRIGSISAALPGGLHVGMQKFLTWYSGVVRKGLGKHLGGQAQVGGWAGHSVRLQLQYVGLSQSECAELVRELGGGVACKAASKVWPPSDAEYNPDGEAGWEPTWEDGDASAYHVGTAFRYFDLDKAEDPTFASGVADLAEQSPKGLVLALNYALGHGSDEALAFANETTVNPQVYQAVGAVKIEILDHRIVPTSATPVDGEAAAGFASLRSHLAALLPGAGSYYNEGDYLTEDFAEMFWGSNYPELLAAKRKYDPGNTFTCHQCVGSRELSPASCGRRLREVGRPARQLSGTVMV